MTATEAGALRSLVRDVQLGYQTAGLSGFSSQVVSETLGRAYQKHRYMVIEQDLQQTQEVRSPEGVEIVKFDGDWSEVLPILTRRGMARFRARLAAGRTCLVAREDGRARGWCLPATPGSGSAGGPSRPTTGPRCARLKRREVSGYSAKSRS